MIISLLCGGGLCALALIHLIGEVIAGVIRYFMAYKICPGLRISYSNANRQTVSSMFHYGAKSWVPSIGDLILNQTTSVLIGVSLGPVPLAIYSRSRSLVRYARDLVAKMAGVLVASVSSLHAAGEHEQIQELVIKSTRYSAFLSFPIGMLLIICGGPLVSIWMGSRYAAPGVAATFALGQTAAVLQLPALAILAGMNKHGRLAFANLVGSILSVGAVAWAVCWLKAGLFPIALAATVPLLMVNAIYGPLHTCRCLNLPISKYLKKAYFNPLVWTLPFGLCLLASRWWFGDHEKLSVMVGGAVGGAVLAPIYWLNVAPPSIKSAIRKRFRRTPAPPALEENAVRTTI
jgi:O-antigen/teichoic acid export membrane protein